MGLKGQQFSTAASIFYVGYLVAQGKLEPLFIRMAMWFITNLSHASPSSLGVFDRKIPRGSSPRSQYRHLGCVRHYHGREQELRARYGFAILPWSLREFRYSGIVSHDRFLVHS
jgi:hypothetical protein